MRTERPIFLSGVVFFTASSRPGGPASSCTSLVFCLTSFLEVSRTQGRLGNQEHRQISSENDDDDAMITVTMATTMIMATPVAAAAASTYSLHRLVVEHHEDG